MDQFFISCAAIAGLLMSQMRVEAGSDEAHPADNVTNWLQSSSNSLPSAARILTAWRQRESRADRFHAQWIHERTYTRFWANCHVPFARDEYVTLRFASSTLLLDGERWRFDAGPVDSSGDAVQFDGGPIVDSFGRGAHDDARRVFRDDRIRYDSGRPRVDPREPIPTDWPRNLRPFTTVVDGRRNVQFLPAERGFAAEAYLFARSENRERTSLHYLPLILTVRPSWLGLSAETCRIEPANELLQGRNCCVLVDDSGLHREFWLDADRDFIVLSYREDCDVLGARMKNRIDISYREDEAGHWLPSAWTTVFFDNHGLMEQYAPATVISASMTADLHERTFDVDFPSGTWMFDEESGRHHIVDDGGGQQPITQDELEQGLSHAELIARGTWFGRATATVKAAWHRASLRFLLFLTLFGGASVGLQRRKALFRR